MVTRPGSTRRASRYARERNGSELEEVLQQGGGGVQRKTGRSNCSQEGRVERHLPDHVLVRHRIVEIRRLQIGEMIGRLPSPVIVQEHGDREASRGRSDKHPAVETRGRRRDHS